MNILIKIIMMGINIVCLLITLAYPNSATPFSLIPIIITTATWVFASIQSGKKAKSTYVIFIVLAMFVSAFCVILGLTTEILPTEGISNRYRVIFHNSVAMCGGMEFPYTYFFIFALLSIIGLIIGEFVGTKKSNKPIGSTFDQIVIKAVKDEWRS